MSVPDDSALLEHSRVYDPAKARAYYLRTRHLKGRRVGSQQPTTQGGTQTKTKSPAAIRREHLEAQKKALEARLDHLKNVLSDLVTAAKARSGIKDPTSTTKDTPQETANKNQDAKKSIPLTAKEKRDKAVQAKKDYAKEHPQSLPKELEQLQGQIQDIQKKIKAAVEDARQRYAKSHQKTA